MRRMTFLNSSGDLTIEWDSANDEQVRRFVEAAMAKGHTFFILSQDGADQIRLRDGHFQRALDKRKLVLFGDTLDTMVEGLVRPVSDGSPSVLPTSRRAKTAEDVVANDTIVTKRAAGG